MNRLDQKLEQLKLENRSGLVCYFTAGDPNFAESCRLLSQLGQAGADIIEVGIPFFRSSGRWRDHSSSTS